jgi:hypothetical protein
MFDVVTDMALFLSLAAQEFQSPLFGAPQVLCRTDDLASLYGVPVWDGKRRTAVSRST